MQLAEGLHRVGSDLVNSYVVEEDGELTIIDAGLPGHAADLEAELVAMGRTLDDVRGVVLTHGDTDHIGYAERLRRDHDIPIHVHESDAPRARGEDDSNGSWGRIRLGPTAKFLWYATRNGGLRIPPVEEVQTFTGGTTLDLPGAPRIIHLPGHTPGSVAIHLPGHDAVAVGDALTTGHVLTGRPGPQPAPFTLEPDTALESLQNLDAIDAQWLLPGHGAPWDRGVGPALSELRSLAAA